MPDTFVKRSRIAAPVKDVFRWHMAPEALELLIPPWERVKIEERTGGIDKIGSRVVMRIGSGPVATRWIAEHTHFEADRMFRDVQIRGPFARWEHTHLVEPDGDEACYLEDRVFYALPMGGLGRLFGGGFVRRKLERVFDHRHRITREALEKERRTKP